MTYQDLAAFAKSKEMFMTYSQEHNFIQAVKIPIADGSIKAMYAKTRFLCSAKSWHCISSEPLRFVCYIDRDGNIRYFNSMFAHIVSDPPDTLPSEKIYVDIDAAIMKEVDNIAAKHPLPLCKKTDLALCTARWFLFDGTNATKRFYYDTNISFAQFIDDKTILDLLTDRPGWAEEVAAKWAGEEFGWSATQEGKITNLDWLLTKRAFQKKVDEFTTQIKEDPTDSVHRYIAMKNAVKGLKTVVVEYRTCFGGVDKTRMTTDAFTNAFVSSRDISKIPLGTISPVKESYRVANLLPRVNKNNHTSQLADEMAKDDVLSIQYRGKVIWKP